MPWYRKTWVTILLLLIFAPVGIFLMFKYQPWNKVIKIILAVFSAIIFFAALGNMGDNSSDMAMTSSQSVNITPEATEEPTPEPTPEATEEPTPEPTPEATEEPTLESAPLPVVSAYAAGGSDSETHFNDYNTPEQQETTLFVLNVSTMKVHEPNCRYVAQIKPENYSTIESLSNALSIGYEPCGVCNPHE